MEHISNSVEAINSHRPIREIRKDIRGALADIGIASARPEKPAVKIRNAKRLMYTAHSLLYQTGRLANKNYKRKVPGWPLPVSNPYCISVLSYGSEKIAYNVCLDNGENVVMGIFHRESLLQHPHEVTKRKKQSYETYVHYFGRLVWPTLFLEVDNPWGEGLKPASFQTYFGEAEELGNLSQDEIARRLNTNPKFSTDFQMLVSGYTRMLRDGLCPDFATTNVLIVGERIILPDTGLLYGADKLDTLRQLHQTFEILDSFSGTMV